MRTTVVCTAVLLLACVAGSVARPAAAAHKPACWQVLLNDWYDGRIDGTYPIHCYQDALKHLPSDVDTYSSARDDIERALQSARIAARKAGTAIDAGTLIRPSSSGKKTGVGKGGGVITIAAPGRKSSPSPIQNVADSSSPSSIPLPLLILGGLALVLVAAGGAGLGWRHFQGRKPGS